MMYSKNFVVAIKIGNKYIRDENGVVKLPFLSEYSLFLKNENSRSAVVSVGIDGKDVLDGKKLIVKANNSIDLEGFIKNNEVTNRFKFIQMTPNIENFRGITPEDSLIRVEYTFEKQIESQITYTYQYVPYPYKYTWYDYKTGCPTEYPIVSCFATSNGSISMNYNLASSKTLLDEGITVKGSEINQPIHNGYIGALESFSNVIILKLIGENIETIRTTRERIICTTCGKHNKSDHSYCQECGTWLG